jgi:deazaflavin-dependent oxidoreductase (nitroreductase family)
MAGDGGDSMSASESTLDRGAGEPTFDRGRPSAWRKLFFKGPIWLYHGPLAELMRSRCVMLLTTTGRRSGQPRTTGVSFMPLDDRIIIFSGWGVRSDWYRNLREHPDVTVQLGTRKLRATAVPVTDPARRRELMRRHQARSAQCGPPGPMRSLLRVTGLFDYDADLQLAVEQGGALPVVELIPHSTAPDPAPAASQ